MADKEKESKAAGEAPETPVKTKKGGKALLLTLPVAGAVLGAAVTMAIPKPSEGGHGAHAPEPLAHVDFAIPEIKANLARAGGLHFAGLDIHVQVKTKDPKHVSERLGIKAEASEGGHGGGGAKKEVPQLQGTLATAVRDRIILLLNAKSIDDLEGREKKELLKREIKEELDMVLFPDKDGEIEAVLFKELLIQ
jgi:flagellar basal body-associated protein FliL